MQHSADFHIEIHGMSVEPAMLLHGLAMTQQGESQVGWLKTEQGGMEADVLLWLP